MAASVYNAMMPADVQYYPRETAPGPRLMARDDLLLDHAVAAGTAALRFYHWAAPTLSLGYFQPAAERLDDPLLAPLPWLRRSTGGAAILHGDGDLTYALALPAGRDWHGAASWVCRMHHLIGTALESFGIDARVVLCGDEKTLGPVHCFLAQTPGDLLIGGSKIVGSAQRRSRGAILQHGTIRLRTSRYAPHVPGIAELAGVTVEPQELIAALETRIPVECAWRLVPTPWTAADAVAAETLADGKYARPKWNGKR